MFSLVVFICFYSFGFFDCISQAGVTDQAHMKLGFKMSALDSFSQAFFFHFTILDSSLRRFDQGRSIFSSALVVLKWRSMS